LIAVVAALVLHVATREAVQGAAVRTFVTPAHLEETRVAIALASSIPVQPLARSIASMAAANVPRAAADDLRMSDVAEVAAPAAAVPTAPSVAAAPVTAPMSAATRGAAPVAAPSRPRSFLERVIAGTSGGPAPSVDLLDPHGARAPPRASDAETARRSVDWLVRASSARGAPPVDAGSLLEELEPTEGGGYRYETGGFIAIIAFDGSLVFISKETQTGLASSALPGRSGDPFEPYGPSLDAPTAVDGTSRKIGNRPLVDSAVTLGSVSFDATAWLLRAQGQDPYEHERLCFLDDTRDLRADLRVAHERTQMAGLRRALERAWFDEDRPAAQRRAALFAIWDECREEEVGLLGRELVESFVRQHLPSGSIDAFPGAELASLNAQRTSTAEFKPYG
jgi:hypothetical protein